MTYLVIFLAILVVLLLLFIGAGFVTPSINYTNEITVNKSAEEAWAVMSDESKLAQWVPGYKKSVLVSGTHNTKGAVSNMYIETNGKEMVMEETITKLEPNELIGMIYKMDFMDMDYEMTYDENKGKTTLRSAAKVTGNGLFARSMVSFMKRTMHAQEEKHLGLLKKLIDENTTNYFPE